MNNTRPKITPKQRDSIAKYFYDISKGLLLAGVIGLFATKISTLTMLGHILFAGYLFLVAFQLEGQNDE